MFTIQPDNSVAALLKVLCINPFLFSSRHHMNDEYSGGLPTYLQPISHFKTSLFRNFLPWICLSYQSCLVYIFCCEWWELLGSSPILPLMGKAWDIKRVQLWMSPGLLLSPRIALTLWRNNVGMEYPGELPSQIPAPAHLTDQPYIHSAGSENIINTGSFRWVVGSTNNIANSFFIFEIFNPGHDTPEFASTRFNITRASSAPTTLSKASSSSSPSVLTTTTTSQKSTAAISNPTSSTADPIQSSSPAQSSSRLNKGQAGGLAAGILVGVALLLAIGFFIHRKVFLRYQSVFNGEHNSTIETDKSSDPVCAVLHHPKPLQGSNIAAELHSQPIHEIGNGHREPWYEPCDENPPWACLYEH